jgi:hypothetical protein
LVGLVLMLLAALTDDGTQFGRHEVPTIQHNLALV